MQGLRGTGAARIKVSAGEHVSEFTKKSQRIKGLAF